MHFSNLDYEIRKTWTSNMKLKNVKCFVFFNKSWFLPNVSQTVPKLWDRRKQTLVEDWLRILCSVLNLATKMEHLLLRRIVTPAKVCHCLVLFWLPAQDKDYRNALNMKDCFLWRLHLDSWATRACSYCFWVSSLSLEECTFSKPKGTYTYQTKWFLFIIT